MLFRFTWDDAKNLTNQKKHRGISFSLASRVFVDPLHVTRPDRSEEAEFRWKTVGLVRDTMLLLVVHTSIEYDADGTAVELIRIISARHATPRERREYAEENGELHN